MEPSVRDKLASLHEDRPFPPTTHRVILGDARDMAPLDAGSAHLVVTSPPYWTLKRYPSGDGQLGEVADYPAFLAEMRRAWAGCNRILAPGGRLCVVVGDVCLSRRAAGRHRVVPIHADFTVQCVDLGFDNLAPIF